MTSFWQRLCALFLISASALCSAQTTSFASDTRPIRIVVITSPGGSADILARVLAEKLSPMLNRPVIVENKAGAGGNIASEFVARAAPDGTTLLLTANNHNINPALYATVPYDPEKDFAAVVQLARGPSVLAVHPSFPFASVAELLAAAKSKPGTISFASGGLGNPGHIQGELFQLQGGVKLNHVPYKGAGPAMTDAVAGQIPVVFGSIASALPFIRAGKLRALGVTSSSRASIAPEVPTIAEAGVPGYEYDLWWGLFAPRSTPVPVVGALNDAVARVLAMPDVRDKLIAQGIDPVGKSSQDFEVMLKDDLAKSIRLVRTANLKAE